MYAGGGSDVCFSIVQYVMKNIKLSASSSKEGEDAEQEVSANMAEPEGYRHYHQFPAGITAVSAATPQHRVIPGVISG